MNFKVSKNCNCLKKCLTKKQENAIKTMTNKSNEVNVKQLIYNYITHLDKFQNILNKKL